MVEIGWIEMPENVKGRCWEIGGGEICRRFLFDILSKKYSVEGGGITGGIFSRNVIKNLYKSLKLSGKKDIWIREINSTILPINKIIGINILNFFHIGGAIPTSYHLSNTILEKLFYRNLNKIDVIVTMSRYWEEYFQKKGYDNVKVIYTAFDMSLFKFTEREIAEFKEEYDLTEKPIIYIGNCQKLKGVVESYKALKDLDVYLVTSGKRKVNVPTINLNLNYRDNQKLLKASSVVVTMSKFPEGWCRTAHEAMLCKTPVVGSGLGGMGELLRGGKQVICKDFNKLRENVEYLMKNPEVGEKSYEYAKQFTVERFEKEWMELISQLIEKKTSTV
jgi:glycosyltransferase involved in cell wall biosynthesis